MSDSLCTMVRNCRYLNDNFWLHLDKFIFLEAFAYVSAMVCGNKALRYIDYPTQVISKCAKPIPVMLIGILLAHKRYVYQKYFFVLMVSAFDK